MYTLLEKQLMKINFIKITTCLMAIAFSAFGQTHKNTLNFNEEAGSPKATLSNINWIQGHWQGNAFGGITEEIWTPPLGNSMMCAFKLVVEHQIKFYEITTITEEEGTLMLRLKHFHQDLKGWEEKNVTQDFRLVKVTENRVYFEGFTFEKISNNEINMYVVINDGEGQQNETRFNYKRVLKNSMNN
ncbi:MAG: DUF6265 family protein [Cyclobacteriaceae bacterium]|jgi:hypothetical protein